MVLCWKVTNIIFNMSISFTRVVHKASCVRRLDQLLMIKVWTEQGSATRRDERGSARVNRRTTSSYSTRHRHSSTMELQHSAQIKDSSRPGG
jgi:hypothetical protein